MGSLVLNSKYEGNRASQALLFSLMLSCTSSIIMPVLSPLVAFKCFSTVY